MTTTTKRPAGRQAQALFMRVVNVPMRALLSLPLPTPLGSRLMLLHITGRRSGRHYRQPVSYVRHGSALLTPGGGNWKLNLAAGQPVHIRLQGHDITARPELVSDLDQTESLLGLLVAHNPRAASFIRIPRDAAGHFDHDALDNAVRHGFRIVRWHPADAKAARVMQVPANDNPTQAPAADERRTRKQRPV
jgi:deazaflavin-dependent oxidoreductase (nitroreductase family)